MKPSAEESRVNGGVHLLPDGCQPGPTLRTERVRDVKRGRPGGCRLPRYTRETVMTETKRVNGL